MSGLSNYRRAPCCWSPMNSRRAAMRQWVGDEQRLVVLDGDGLAFTSHGLIVEDRPPGRRLSPHSPRTSCAWRRRADHRLRTPDDRPGDTLQAVRDHAFAHPLVSPASRTSPPTSTSIDCRLCAQGWCGGHLAGYPRRLADPLASASAPKRWQKPTPTARKPSARPCPVDRPRPDGRLFKVIALHHPHCRLLRGSNDPNCQAS